ncbi:MAG TPA: hypothetical protein VNC59_03265 [Thermoanaerobaculia bacterium]|nr:hypothetical protein [Thermoanaerobaculia bacterium]
MKSRIFALLAIAALVAGCATQPETKVVQEGSATTVKQTGPGANVDTTIVTGVVTKYMPGQEIEIKAADGNSWDFDLEDSLQVQGSIMVGKPATIHYTEQSGVKRVTVLTGS